MENSRIWYYSWSLRVEHRGKWFLLFLFSILYHRTFHLKWFNRNFVMHILHLFLKNKPYNSSKLNFLFNIILWIYFHVDNVFSLIIFTVANHLTSLLQDTLCLWHLSEKHTAWVIHMTCEDTGSVTPPYTFNSLPLDSLWSFTENLKLWHWKRKTVFPHC